MLIIFDDVDQGGKTTMAKRLSEYLGITYIKLKNINIEDNNYIKDGVSISTHSQIETVLQLYEKGVIKDVILDRFHVSEFVYSKLFNRVYNNNYIREVENRLSKFNDVLIIRCRPDYETLKARWKANERIVSTSLLTYVLEYYDEWYASFAKIPNISIDTSNAESISFFELSNELLKRSIYPNHLRNRRWEHQETMIEIAKTIAHRGTCLNRQVGAVLTEDGYIVGVGYNGPPSGLAHCTTCLRRERHIPSGQQMELSRAIHAEINAIQQSGIRSRSDKYLELFTTDSPCKSCMVSLIQIGINKIYYIHKYNDELAWIMAKEAGVEMIPVEV
jgi:dCMP deaminase